MMDCYNATLTAMCEIIEDAIANGFPASEVPNVLADIPAELDGRAVLDQLLAENAARMMKEAAR